MTTDMEELFNASSGKPVPMELVISSIDKGSWCKTCSEGSGDGPDSNHTGCLMCYQGHPEHVPSEYMEADVIE